MIPSSARRAIECRTDWRDFPVVDPDQRTYLPAPLSYAISAWAGGGQRNDVRMVRHDGLRAGPLALFHRRGRGGALPRRPYPQQDRLFPTLVSVGVRAARQPGRALGLGLH